MFFFKRLVIPAFVLIAIFIAIQYMTSDKEITTMTTLSKVIKKAHSSDEGRKWIIIQDSMDNSTNNPLKIYVQNPSIWNLIQKKEETYLMTFYKKSDSNDWILQWIALSDQKQLR